MATESTHDKTSPRHGLTERDKAILSFENRWWQHAGLKEEAIRAELELSPARYYQILSGLIDRTDALIFDPMLVKRLLRLRQARLAARERRATGME
ncbi:DUF3263 domain-containing protein [Mycetocola spongiae]|uniref:DUF3263 domain-containing protein n=1 Tax=Mycetocola spongiae TaxID=2859226 RepID=UPI001CF49F1E|nr:DUF3263 domain-containing protein [Mycetocola spongiae]UCR88785.1 DUF3263 domain-containing protein [Mycetocola spongiae]